MSTLICNTMGALCLPCRATRGLLLVHRAALVLAMTAATITLHRVLDGSDLESQIMRLIITSLMDAS